MLKYGLAALRQVRRGLISTPFYIQAFNMHIKARGPHPQYPDRASVPDEKVEWSAEFADYQPVEFEHAAVLANDSTKKQGGWADPADLTKCGDLAARVTYTGSVTLGEDGRPQNPCGRTGMKGRGLLGKWGPNHAADPIVTRKGPDGGMQMVAIRRQDTGLWAIPGGMVDPGETVSVTVRREFEEEAGNVAEDKREELKQMLDELFSNGKDVFKGYIDDPRNTDNAWMESCALHFHCTEELGNALHLHAGDDAADVKWLNINDSVPEFANLYASHKALVLDAVKNY